ncbi:SHOCT domain-containing protein [Embleya sp. NPDC059237]|uniref:SHOCT domain-containing protein n=1 Tax=Embleya sp. NPDC059237 TaxID=3346784 RepID=UPI0036A67D44
MSSRTAALPALTADPDPSDIDAAVDTLVAVVWFLARGASHGRGPSGPAAPSAIEVLAQRYARGEIDTEEYRERLAVLTTGAHTPRGSKGRGRESDTRGD